MMRRYAALVCVLSLQGCLLLSFSDDYDAGTGGTMLGGDGDAAGDGDAMGDGDAAGDGDAMGDGDAVMDAAVDASSGDAGMDASTDAATDAGPDEDAGLDDAGAPCDLAEASCTTCEKNSVTCVAGDVSVVCDAAGKVAARHACPTKTDDPCLVGVCTADVGCEIVPAEGSPACGSDLFCFAAGVCVAGKCELGEPRSCHELDGACTRGVCNEGMRKCLAVPDNEGLSCQSGRVCEIGACVEQ